MSVIKTRYVVTISCLLLLFLATDGLCKRRKNKFLQFSKVKDFPLTKEELSALKSKTKYQGKDLFIQLVRNVIKSWDTKEEGNSPFRLCLSARYRSNRRIKYFFDGEGELFFINAKKELVAQTRKSLKKLCPS